MSVAPSAEERVVALHALITPAALRAEIDTSKQPGTGSSILSAIVPKPGSDSDIHLVSDSDQDMQLPSDSGAPAARAGGSPPPADSEPQIVPFDEGLGAKGPRSPSDSDVRLEKDTRGSSGELPATEEVHIDLDSDLIKEVARSDAETKAKSKAKPKARAKTPNPAAEQAALNTLLGALG